MLQIHKITVPTPYMVGPVNCYLIKNRPYTLVDPGPETEEAKKALVDGLAALGVSLKDIERVVITHSHSDHCGLIRWVNEQAGTATYVHRLEMRKLAYDYDYYLERIPFLREAGLPFKVLKEIFEDPDPVVKPVLPKSKVVELQGGDELDFDGGVLRVIHLPGHCGGHICLYEPEGKDFLAGDFILKHITPNPIMEADPVDFSKRLPSLTQYLEGLALLEKFDIRVILPGHGKIIDESREVVSRAQKHHQQSLENISSILKGNRSSVYQVMRVLYPNISGFQVFLGVSEVFAHVDYLLARGMLDKEMRGEVSFFAKFNAIK